MNALVKIDPKVFTTAVVKADPVYQKTTAKKQKDLSSASKFGNNLLKLFEKKQKDNAKRDSDNKKELERQKALSEEKRSELKKAGGNILRSTLAKAKDIIGGLQHLIMGLVAYKILDWISDPNNKGAVKGLLIAIKGIFDFISSAVTFGVTNVMEGISQLTKGTLLEKFFGILKIIAGVFVLRWILNPLKLVKDLGRLVKAIPRIRKLFGFLSNVGKKGILPAIKDATKALASAKGITTKSISKVVRRSLLRILGKGGFKALTAGLSKGGGAIAKALYKASGGVIKGGLQRTATRAGLKLLGKSGLKTAGKIFSKIPIIGGLLDFGLNIALGDPVDKAAVKAVGSMLGGALGGFIGSVIPGPGTFVGAVLGGLLGDYLADKAYGFFKNISSNANKKPAEGKDKIPGLATGGIVTKPTLAHLAEDEPEVVIPLSKVGPGSIVDSILGRPFKILGSAFLGALMGITGSLGPLGFVLQPIIKSLLGPFIKEYGMKNIPMKKMAQGPTTTGGSVKMKKTNTDDEKASKIIGSTPSRNGTDMLSLLFRIEKAMLNFSGGSSGGGGGGSKASSDTGSDDKPGDVDTGGIDAATGSVVDKGAAIAKKLMSNLSGMTKEAAAAIAGNFAHESSGFIPGIREGGPFGKNSKPWPRGTVGKGYGWAQWTNSAPGDRYDKFIQSYGGDYNKVPTNEDNLRFAVQEMKTTNKLSDKFKKMTDVGAAAVWFRKNWERAGVHHDGPRISYAKGILNKLSGGGAIKGSNKDKFFTVMNMAKAAGDKIPEITAAQFALESGYGTALSGKYNYFGQKGTPGTKKLTTEYSGGSPYKTYAVFKDYPSPQASIGEHVKQWSLDYKGYKGYGSSGNASNAAYHLKKQGYATDPAYPGKLIRIIKEHGLNPGKPSPENIPAGGDPSSLGGGDAGGGDTSGGNQQTAAAESSSTGVDYLKANAGSFVKDLSQLFSIMTGAPMLTPGSSPSQTPPPTYSAGKVDANAFKNIKPLTEDYNKYYNGTQSSTVAMFSQPPVIVNTGVINNTIMSNPVDALSSSNTPGFNLQQRL